MLYLSAVPEDFPDMDTALSAGAKADPSRVRVMDLSEASLDPLARKVRHQLRIRHGIGSGIPMVLSSEKPRCSLIPISQLSHDPHELQVRRQPLPPPHSLGHLCTLLSTLAAILAIPLHLMPFYRDWHTYPSFHSLCFRMWL